MLILERTYDSITELSCDLNLLNEAIGTSYIPVGETVEALVGDFTKTQLARRFNPRCGTPASLEAVFDEKKFQVNYASTRGTTVSFAVEFDNDMQPSEIWLNVGIPDDRAKPGRTHYEAITRALCRFGFYRWLKRPDGVEVMAVETGSKRPVEYLPVPRWQLDEISDRIEPEKRDALLAKYGFSPVQQRGFKQAWQHDDGRVLITLDGSKNRVRRYAFLEETYFPDYGFSFRQLLLNLKRRAKLPAPATSEEEEYEDYAGADEDYQLDE